MLSFKEFLEEKDMSKQKRIQCPECAMGFTKKEADKATEKGYHTHSGGDPKRKCYAAFKKAKNGDYLIWT